MVLFGARQGFERSVKYPRFEAGLPASPVRGREGLAALVSGNRLPACGIVCNRQKGLSVR